jgi:hypothetical protein
MDCTASSCGRVVYWTLKALNLNRLTERAAANPIKTPITLGFSGVIYDVFQVPPSPSGYLSRLATGPRHRDVFKAHVRRLINQATNIALIYPYVRFTWVRLSFTEA